MAAAAALPLAASAVAASAPQSDIRTVGSPGKEEAALDIVIPLYDAYEPLDVVGPYEVLAYMPGASVRFVGAEKGPVKDALGSLPTYVPATYSEVKHCDVLLIPGGRSAEAMVADGDFLAWVRRIHTRTKFTTSVCTGSLVLGAAGLLKGLTATTHWSAAEALASYGAVYTPQRTVRQGKVITSAGVSSGIDMALALAALLTDEVTAQALQLWIEYDPQPPFDSGSLAKASDAVKKRISELREEWSHND
ncbi:DJ-1/PfpI family protein [Streptomyces sp. NBRC 110028]|uniref:DJ-1/PfpI family protein n=1 Tax=Streptomyces sp. NBRC 110028 TaxID=1621260 RepID=UPI000AE4024D|nr:DJ-1/PfpI family protein [Streptomyces sp. NBRC 110028]